LRRAGEIVEHGKGLGLRRNGADNDRCSKNRSENKMGKVTSTHENSLFVLVFF
jgi:hypothetical protein